MRILYDGSIYGFQIAGGINRYFGNLISRLPADFTPVITGYETFGVNAPCHSRLKTFQYRRFRPHRLSHRLEPHYFRMVNACNRFDIAHPTYYSQLTQESISKSRIPVVLTVWDMIHERFAEQMDPNGDKAQEKHKAILAAQAIICISENTKQDLQSFYGIPDEKITVTYLASELNIDLSYGNEAVPLRPYYLYVGSRSVYKNFGRLLCAFSKFVTINKNASLCIVGPSFNEEEQRLIASLHLTDYIEHYGYATDTHLAKLYRSSLAFVYPTLYEGFGIPPLEAMSCGTIVIASECSSIPEVVGNAGLLFDPTNVNDLVDILIAVYSGTIDRQDLIAKGFVKASSFSWNKTTEQTICAYKSVLH